MFQKSVEGNLQGGSDFCMILQHKCLVTLRDQYLYNKARPKCHKLHCSDVLCRLNLIHYSALGRHVVRELRHRLVTCNDCSETLFRKMCS